MMPWEAIEDYIRRDMNLHGGHFLFYDHMQRRPLSLTYARPSEPGMVIRSGEREFATCVVMTSDAGEKFDFDFITVDDGGCRQVRGISLHMVDKLPRYQWTRVRNGIWKQRPYWDPPPRMQ